MKEALLDTGLRIASPSGTVTGKKKVQDKKIQGKNSQITDENNTCHLNALSSSPSSFAIKDGQIIGNEDDLNLNSHTYDPVFHDHPEYDINDNNDNPKRQHPSNFVSHDDHQRTPTIGKTRKDNIKNYKDQQQQQHLYNHSTTPNRKSNKIINREGMKRTTISSPQIHHIPPTNLHRTYTERATTYNHHHHGSEEYLSEKHNYFSPKKQKSSSLNEIIPSSSKSFSPDENMNINASNISPTPHFQDTNSDETHSSFPNHKNVNINRDDNDDEKREKLERDDKLISTEVGQQIQSSKTTNKKPLHIKEETLPNLSITYPNEESIENLTVTSNGNDSLPLGTLESEDVLTSGIEIEKKKKKRKKKAKKKLSNFHNDIVTNSMDVERFEPSEEIEMMKDKGDTVEFGGNQRCLLMKEADGYINRSGLTSATAAAMMGPYHHQQNHPHNLSYEQYEVMDINHDGHVTHSGNHSNIHNNKAFLRNPYTSSHSHGGQNSSNQLQTTTSYYYNKNNTNPNNNMHNHYQRYHPLHVPFYSDSKFYPPVGTPHTNLSGVPQHSFSQGQQYPQHIQQQALYRPSSSSSNRSNYSHHSVAPENNQLDSNNNYSSTNPNGKGSYLNHAGHENHLSSTTLRKRGLPATYSSNNKGERLDKDNYSCNSNNNFNEISSTGQGINRRQKHLSSMSLHSLDHNTDTNINRNVKEGSSISSPFTSNTPIDGMRSTYRTEKDELQQEDGERRQETEEKEMKIPVSSTISTVSTSYSTSPLPNSHFNSPHMEVQSGRSLSLPLSSSISTNANIQNTFVLSSSKIKLSSSSPSNGHHIENLNSEETPHCQERHYDIVNPGTSCGESSSVCSVSSYRQHDTVHDKEKSDCNGQKDETTKDREQFCSLESAEMTLGNSNASNGKNLSTRKNGNFETLSIASSGYTSRKHIPQMNYPKTIKNNNGRPSNNNSQYPTNGYHQVVSSHGFGKRRSFPYHYHKNAGSHSNQKQIRRHPSNTLQNIHMRQYIHTTRMEMLTNNLISSLMPCHRSEAKRMTTCRYIERILRTMIEQKNQEMELQELRHAMMVSTCNSDTDLEDVDLGENQSKSDYSKYDCNQNSITEIKRGKRYRLRCSVVGSFPLKTYLPDSDLDMTIFIDEEEVDENKAKSLSEIENKDTNKNGSKTEKSKNVEKENEEEEENKHNNEWFVHVAQALIQESITKTISQNIHGMNNNIRTQSASMDLERKDQEKSETKSLPNQISTENSNDFNSRLSSYLKPYSTYENYSIHNVSYINARTNVLNCMVQNLSVDITINQPNALRTLIFLEEMDRLIGRNHLFKRSILLLKAWCQIESSKYFGFPLLSANSGTQTNQTIPGLGVMQTNIDLNSSIPNNTVSTVSSENNVQILSDLEGNGNISKQRNIDDSQNSMEDSVTEITSNEQNIKVMNTSAVMYRGKQSVVTDVGNMQSQGCFTTYALCLLILSILRAGDDLTITTPLGVLMKFLSTFSDYSSSAWGSNIITTEGVMSVSEFLSSTNQIVKNDRVLQLITSLNHSTSNVLRNRGKDGKNDPETEGSGKETLNNANHTNPYFPLRSINILDPLNNGNNLAYSTVPWYVGRLQEGFRAARKDLDYLLNNYDLVNYDYNFEGANEYYLNNSTHNNFGGRKDHEKDKGLNPYSIPYELPSNSEKGNGKGKYDNTLPESQSQTGNLFPISPSSTKSTRNGQLLNNVQAMDFTSIAFGHFFGRILAKYADPSIRRSDLLEHPCATNEVFVGLNDHTPIQSPVPTPPRSSKANVNNIISADSHQGEENCDGHENDSIQQYDNEGSSFLVGPEGLGGCDGETIDSENGDMEKEGDNILRGNLSYFLQTLKFVELSKIDQRNAISIYFKNRQKKADFEKKKSILLKILNNNRYKSVRDKHKSEGDSKKITLNDLDNLTSKEQILESKVSNSNDRDCNKEYRETLIPTNATNKVRDIKNNDCVEKNSSVVIENCNNKCDEELKDSSLSTENEAHIYHSIATETPTKIYDMKEVRNVHAREKCEMPPPNTSFSLNMLPDRSVLGNIIAKDDDARVSSSCHSSNPVPSFVSIGIQTDDGQVDTTHNVSDIRSFVENNNANKKMDLKDNKGKTIIDKVNVVKGTNKDQALGTGINRNTNTTEGPFNENESPSIPTIPISANSKKMSRSEKRSLRQKEKERNQPLDKDKETDRYQKEKQKIQEVESPEDHESELSQSSSLSVPVSNLKSSLMKRKVFNDQISDEKKTYLDIKLTWSDISSRRPVYCASFLGFLTGICDVCLFILMKVLKVFASIQKVFRRKLDYVDKMNLKQWFVLIVKPTSYSMLLDKVKDSIYVFCGLCVDGFHSLSIMFGVQATSRLPPTRSLSGVRRLRYNLNLLGPPFHSEVRLPILALTLIICGTVFLTAAITCLCLYNSSFLYIGQHTDAYPEGYDQTLYPDLYTYANGGNGRAKNDQHQYHAKTKHHNLFSSTEAPKQKGSKQNRILDSDNREFLFSSSFSSWSILYQIRRLASFFGDTSFNLNLEDKNGRVNQASGSDTSPLFSFFHKRKNESNEDSIGNYENQKLKINRDQSYTYSAKSSTQKESHSRYQRGKRNNFFEENELEFMSNLIEGSAVSSQENLPTKKNDYSNSPSYREKRSGVGVEDIHAKKYSDSNNGKPSVYSASSGVSNHRHSHYKDETGLASSSSGTFVTSSKSGTTASINNFNSFVSPPITIPVWVYPESSFILGFLDSSSRVNNFNTVKSDVANFLDTDYFKLLHDENYITNPTPFKQRETDYPDSSSIPVPLSPSLEEGVSRRISYSYRWFHNNKEINTDITNKKPYLFINKIPPKLTIESSCNNINVHDKNASVSAGSAYIGGDISGLYELRIEETQAFYSTSGSILQTSHHLNNHNHLHTSKTSYSIYHMVSLLQKPQVKRKLIHQNLKQGSTLALFVTLVTPNTQKRDGDDKTNDGMLTKSSSSSTTSTSDNILAQKGKKTNTEGLQPKIADNVITLDERPQYQWRLNGQIIPGATSSTYYVHKVSLKDAGTYTCAVSNMMGTVIWEEAIITVY